MGRLLNGDIPVNSSTFSDVTKILKDLAENGPGEVKTTAQFVLDSLDGKAHSHAEQEEQTKKFKDYCMNYTVG